MTAPHISIALAVCWFVIVCALPASAEGIAITFDDGPSFTTRTIQMFVLISVLSVVPGLAIMITCFPFLVTVLSILRQAIGLQQAPPNMLIVTLALFLTYFIMDPIFTRAWAQGVDPFVSGSIQLEEAFSATLEPFRTFMADRTDPDTYTSMEELRQDVSPVTAISAAPLSILVPSFLLSEISHAFQVGFLIYLPFLIIDLVVSAILMSMGMMMVPPAVVSLPFKLAFFVMADGWALVSNALVRGYL